MGNGRLFASLLASASEKEATVPKSSFTLPIRPFGIPIYLDWSWFIAVPLISWMVSQSLAPMAQLFGVDPEPLQGGVLPLLIGVLCVLGLFLSVLIHEFGHAVVALRLGIDVKSVRLWLLGGIARIDEMPKTKGIEAVIAIAGPITSGALGMVCFGLSQLVPEGSPVASFIFSYLTYMNVILGAFNLVPALPLDGGRVLRSLLAVWLPHEESTRICVLCSRMVCVGFVLLGLLTNNFWLLFIAAFVFLGSSAELAAVSLKRSLAGVMVRDIMTPHADAVPSHMLVEDLLESMLEHRHLGFPVVDLSGEVVGAIALEDLRRSIREGRAKKDARIAEVMTKPVPTCSPDEAVEDVLQKMIADEAEHIAVTDERGQLVGLLSKTDVHRYVQVNQVRPFWSRRRAPRPNYDEFDPDDPNYQDPTHPATKEASP